MLGQKAADSRGDEPGFRSGRLRRLRIGTLCLGGQAVQLHLRLRQRDFGLSDVKGFRRPVFQPADRCGHAVGEYRVHRLENGLAGAEVMREQNSLPILLPCRFGVRVGAVFPKKNRRVRHAEAIDRLLDVADHEAVFPVF